ncbi:hypothetical protein UFOVP236_18 [uncultured Caudovirales phage]|uniref:Uncharacterized protein n=1 Tax=uncultured Caudovirales phage TaxID=2100421 RepID=A0A6J7WVX0_9CAUD|nr:hypothetical protein UFOVP236_18 [uncultured Caudovirales phage]
MSNPYDLTSGYLAARQLKMQEEDAKELRGIRSAQSKYYTSNAEKLDLENEMTRKTMPLIDSAMARFKPKGIGLNATAPLDFKSISKGYSFGMKPDYSIVPGGSASSSAPAEAPAAAPTDVPFDQGTELPTGGIQYPSGAVSYPVKLADGIRGGIRVPPVDAQAAPPAAEPAPEAAPQADQGPSGIELLAERNPKLASSVTQNVFGMSNKEFQQFSGAMAMVDFAKGKITSDQLTDHVEKLRKIQAEGVMRAAQAALSGNEKQAIDLYHEYGEDSASVAGMKKMKIANPVPGAAKGTKDFYDGVEVTMKDGSKVTLDPRRLSLDIIGTAKAMEHDEKVASSIRSTDASVYSTDTHAATNRLNAKMHQDQMNERSLDKAMDRVKGELTSDLGQLRKSFLDPSSPQFIVDEAARKTMSDRIDLDAQNAINVANANINIFSNPRISYQGVKQAMSGGKVVLQDGKPVTKDVNGQTYALTPFNNIWIPVSPQQKPAQ